MSIFVSYTLKDGAVTVKMLQELKQILSDFSSCYIDILDNDSKDKQKRVYDELRKSQLLLIIESPLIQQSKWVNMEYEFAKAQNIPIKMIDIKKYKMIKEILMDDEYKSSK